jgi:hypothetical protein
LALWLSMIAALGLASRPARSRVSTLSAWWMRANVPSQSHSIHVLQHSDKPAR